MVETSLELDELINNYKELGYINEKQQKRVKYSETKAIWLVVSYILFQGIIFHSITSQPSNISCNQWWIPFSLSLLIAIMFGITFIITITKWSRMQYHYELNMADRDLLYYKIFFIKHRHQEGMNNNNNNQSIKQQQQKEIMKPDIIKAYQREAYIWAMVAVLLAFTVVVLLACRSLLCR